MTFANRPTVALIHLDRLRANGKQILSRLQPGQEGLAIIKANAYGHGSVLCMRALEAAGYRRFGVATLEEGLELRRQGLRSEIYVLDGLMGQPADFLGNRLYPVIHTTDEFKVLSEYLSEENRDFLVSLKFDTGMGRLGFAAAQVDELIGLLKRQPFIKVVSVLTHLARADEPENDATLRQFVLFRKLREILRERGLTGAKYSIANSAAILDGKLEDYDWVRPGICLYGCLPNERFRASADLQPVLELKTRVLSVKKFPPYSSIGYGGTFETKRDSTIAVLPIGYADGYPRLVSNRGSVLIHGKRAPIVGRISMDLMTVDVTDIAPDVQVGDDVILIGRSESEQIRAEDVASWAETISYEILCGLTARVPRIYQGM